MRNGKKMPALVCLLLAISIIHADSLSCWFDPEYQSPPGIRDVWCNFSDSMGAPMAGATITHSTYDTNDWWKNGLMGSKGWIVGYEPVSNLSKTEFALSGTAIIDRAKKHGFKYGPYTFPFHHINQTVYVLMKAGSGASQISMWVCNDTYQSAIFGHTPANLSVPSLYLGCAPGQTINASSSSVNYQNWTWAAFDITGAYNSVAGDAQDGNMEYFLYLETQDNLTINPVGWSIDPRWMPPMHNETLEAYNLSSSSLKPKDDYPLPDSGGYDPANNINMSGSILLLHMEDAGTNGTALADHSGEGHNATLLLSSAVQNASSPGIFNRSMNFDGINDYASLDPGDNSSFNMQGNFTVMAWVRENNPGGYSGGNNWQNMVGKGGDSGWQLQHSQYNTKFEFALKTDSGRSWVQSQTYPVAGEWYHVAGVYDGSRIRIYVNGIEEASSPRTGIPSNTTQPPVLGARLNEGGSRDRFFNGSLDEVAVFDRALSADEISYIASKSMSLVRPDNRTHQSETYIKSKNYINLFGGADFNSSTGYLQFSNGSQYAKFMNTASFSTIGNKSWTSCFFFRRNDTSYDNNEKIWTCGESMEILLMNSYNAPYGHILRLAVQEDQVSHTWTVLDANSNRITDTEWHHVCGVRDTSASQLRIILDGEVVASEDFSASIMIRPPNECILGRDVASGGSDEPFSGQIAQFFFHNDSHTSAEISEGINSAWWMVALPETESPGHAASGSLANSTTISWNSEPTHVPINYVKIFDENANMTYNSTAGLYHFTYYTNNAELATSQGASGVNFTTLFNATRDGLSYHSDTRYWHVAASEGSNCSIDSYGWEDPSRQGQYRRFVVNWSVSSATPVSIKGLAVCPDQAFNPGAPCTTFTDEGAATFEAAYYGNYTLSCFSRNDFDNETYHSGNSTFEAGCWNPYDDYDGGRDPLEMRSDVYLCPGTHTVIPKPDSYILVNDGSHRLFLLGSTTVDGGGVRYGPPDWGTFYWAYNLHDRVMDARGMLTVQNGEIGFYTVSNASNFTIANIRFINMSIGFDLEHDYGDDFYLVNNTFTNCGLNGENPVYITGEGAILIGNWFGDLPAGANSSAHVYCDGCQDVVLEQNHFPDVASLSIFTDGTNRSASTPIGTLSCMVGTFGSQYPYSRANGGGLYGDISDPYPCTNRTYESGCANLSQPSTWLGRIVNVSGVLYINNATEICPGSYPSSGSMIRINSSEANLDCQGAELIGPGGGTGIDTAGFDNIAISNCDISGFDEPFVVDGTSGASFSNNTIHSNSGYALRLDSSASNTFSGTVIYGQAEIISSTGSSGNTFSGLTIMSGTSQIYFPSINYGSSALDSSSLEMGEYFVSLDSSAAPEFNTTARITIQSPACPATIYYMDGHPASREEILSGGAPCTDCSAISCGGGMVTFEVPHFTGYATGFGANLTISNNGPAPSGENITFTAYYRNSTSGAHIPGAVCNLSTEGSAYGMAELADRYELNLTVSGPGIHDYNVTCSAPSFSAITAYDTYSVLGGVNGSTIELHAANVTIGPTGRYSPNITAGNLTTEGGNVTNVNLTSNASTDRWAGFYGNITGNLVLAQAADVQMVYVWPWDSAYGGTVCASTLSSFTSANASGASGPDIDSAWSFPSSAADSGANTFNNPNCSLGFGPITINESYYADTGSAGGFRTCTFKTASAPSKNEMLFCTNITENGPLFNGGTGDFEMMVPTEYGPSAYETYYFYLNLN